MSAVETRGVEEVPEAKRGRCGVIAHTDAGWRQARTYRSPRAYDPDAVAAGSVRHRCVGMRRQLGRPGVLAGRKTAPWQPPECGLRSSPLAGCTRRTARWRRAAIALLVQTCERGRRRWHFGPRDLLHLT